MKKPEDYWDEDLSWIKCYWDTDIDEIANRLVNEMKLIPRDGDADTEIPARDVFTPEDIRAVKALYYGVLHGCLFCGVFEKCESAIDRAIFDSSKQIALNCAEFTFMNLHPEYNSYMTFYQPVSHVVEYMHNHWEELVEEDKRRQNARE